MIELSFLIGLTFTELINASFCLLFMLDDAISKANIYVSSPSTALDTLLHARKTPFSFTNFQTYYPGGKAKSNYVYIIKYDEIVR